MNDAPSSAIIERRASLSHEIALRQKQRWADNKHASPLIDEALTEFLEQTQADLLNLSESVAVARESLFIDYVAWVKATWEPRGIPTPVIKEHFAIIAEVLREQLSVERYAAPVAILDAALEQFAEMPSQLPTRLKKDRPLGDMAKQYLNLLLARERNKACQLIVNGVQDGISVQDIYLHVFQAVLEEIGRLWQLNRISVANEHYCTAATQLIMSQLYPSVFSHSDPGPRIVVTCAAGELHEFGPRMLADLFELAGWDTCYLGANTPVGSTVDMLIEHKAELLAVSATLSSHLGSIRELISAVRGNHRCQHIKILVGGDPFVRVPDLWRDVGADGTAGNAADAIDWGNQNVPGD